MEPEIILKKEHSCSRSAHVATGVALLLVGAGIGAGAVSYFPSSNANNTYQAGFTAARTLVENSSMGGFFKVQSDVRTMYGAVTAIQGNQITVHAGAFQNPFDTQTWIDKVITIAPATQIDALVLRNTKVAAATTTASLYTPVPANTSSIKVGSTVVVTATENIKNLKSFTASKIQIQPNLPK